MGLIKPDDGWRLPDELWQQMEPLLPARKAHPLGCHNPRVSDRAAMNAILFVLRTGAQWNSLNATGICSSSAAHRRFQEWVQAGLFEEFWRLGLLNLQALDGIDWSWLALDGAMTKAPLGGEKNRPQPYRPRQRRGQAQCADRGARHPAGRGGRRGQSAGHEAGRGDADRADGAPPAADARQAPRVVPGQGGYDHEAVRELVAQLGFTAHLRSRGEEQRDIRELGYRARRWVVERTHSSMNRFRGLLVRWAKKAENYLAFMHLACGITTWRATGLLG